MTGALASVIQRVMSGRVARPEAAGGPLRRLLALLLLQVTSGCQRIFLTEIRLDPSTEIARYSYSSHIGSCSCCGLCYQHSDCAAFSVKDAECILFNSAGSYDTVVPDSGWQFFQLPGRSGHHQFCDEDADCQAPGDSCRAGVCSQLDTITCQVIHQVLGAGYRIATDDRRPEQLPGLLNGQPMTLACLMYNGRGFTRLVSSDDKHPFSHANIFSQNEDLTDRHESSVLRLAQEIADTGTTATYHMLVEAHGGGGGGILQMELPRTEPVVASQQRPNTGTVLVDEFGVAGSLGLLWVQPQQKENRILTLTQIDSKNIDVGDLARTDGYIYLDKLRNKAAVFISEE